MNVIRLFDKSYTSVNTTRICSHLWFFTCWFTCEFHYHTVMGHLLSFLMMLVNCIYWTLGKVNPREMLNMTRYLAWWNILACAVFDLFADIVFILWPVLFRGLSSSYSRYTWKCPWPGSLLSLHKYILFSDVSDVSGTRIIILVSLMHSSFLLNSFRWFCLPSMSETEFIFAQIIGMWCNFFL